MVGRDPTHVEGLSRHTRLSVACRELIQAAVATGREATISTYKANRSGPVHRNPPDADRPRDAFPICDFGRALCELAHTLTID